MSKAAAARAIDERHRPKTTALKAKAPAHLQVRPAAPTDHASLSFFFDTALRRDYFLRRGQLEDMLKGTHHRILIAELDAVLVGVAILTAGVRLVNVLVHPAYRGLQIGAALIERSDAAEVRCKRDMTSGDPLRFYQRLGFKPTGRRNAKGNIEVLRRDGSAAPNAGGCEHADT